MVTVKLGFHRIFENCAVLLRIARRSRDGGERGVIFLVNDFGVAGPYVGQMRTVLLGLAPNVPVIDLVLDAPIGNPKASAYLLASMVGMLPRHSTVLAIVDPGVGTSARRPVVVNVEQRWFVAPDNGLLDVVTSRCHSFDAWLITWQPERLSASFHGRDLFAPIAARLARHDLIDASWLTPTELTSSTRGWGDDLFEIIYVDHFGNAMTGIRATQLAPESLLVVNGHDLSYARTFGAVASGASFWYENSNGLVEIAVNCGRADKHLGIGVGDSIAVIKARSQ